MSKNTENYFWKQTEITNQKLEFYKNYIENYSIKLLMWYWVLFVADLFCWSWTNWKERWSPLILIDILNNVLKSDTLLKNKPDAKIILLLNDSNKENISILENILKEYTIDNKINIITKNDEFNWILESVKSLKDYKNMPKFFFLDPFTFSIISVNNLKLLMDLWLSEVLMFSPIFDAYRFKTAKNILDNENHKTRKFIEEYTNDWLIDYSDIHDFNHSIIKKLRKELKTDYVKYILLNWGKRQNALFHTTSHISGSLLFTKISRKLWDYWMGIDVKFKENSKIQWCLFDPWEIECDHLLRSFEIFLIDILKEKALSNINVVELATINGFEPSEANQILKKYKTSLEIKYLTDKNNWYYISETAWKEKPMCTIKFKK